jgi:hypothetical protein
MRTPSGLAKAIRIVRASLDDGAIREVEDESVMGFERFRDLQEAGPWPYFIKCRFACTTRGAKFKLSVLATTGASAAAHKLGEIIHGALQQEKRRR